MPSWSMSFRRERLERNPGSDRELHHKIFRDFWAAALSARRISFLNRRLNEKIDVQENTHRCPQY